MTLAKERLDALTRAIHRAKSLYFHLEDARELIAECERKDLAVVGIEALTLEDNGKILPHLDLIADYRAAEIDWSGYTWDAFRKECNKSALRFLSTAQASGYLNLVFDFQVMNKNEFDSYLRRHESRRRLLGLADT